MRRLAVRASTLNIKFLSSDTRRWCCRLIVGSQASRVEDVVVIVRHTMKRGGKKEKLAERQELEIHLNYSDCFEATNSVSIDHYALSLSLASYFYCNGGAFTSKMGHIDRANGCVPPKSQSCHLSLFRLCLNQQHRVQWTRDWNPLESEHS